MTWRACVRCGRDGRIAETFLCHRCLEDPRTVDEVEEAFRQEPQDPRTYVVEELHWVGGWRVGGRERARA